MMHAPLLSSLRQHGTLDGEDPPADGGNGPKGAAAAAEVEADGSDGAAAGGAALSNEQGGGPLKVGLLTVGSGRYGAFSRANTMSAEKYLLRGVAELHYFIFSDDVAAVEAQYKGQLLWEQGRVHVMFRAHDGWPSASMKRSFTYLEHLPAWQHMDYVFAGAL